MQRTRHEEGEKKNGRQEADKKQTKIRTKEKEREENENRSWLTARFATLLAGQATRETQYRDPEVGAQKRRRTSHQDLTGQVKGGN